MAGFFDDLGKRLSETANDLGKKAEDTVEIQKRKSDIRFLGRANDRDYMDIGKIIFEKYRNGEVVDTDMAALCEAISGSCSSYLWNGSLSEEACREMCKIR